MNLFCEVNGYHLEYCVLYLQPGDDYEVVEGSQFVVSRTARKDSSSDYHVNGRKVPFKEVARLLKDCGIDLDHNRFLILQVGFTFTSCIIYKALSDYLFFSLFTFMTTTEDSNFVVGFSQV